MIRNEHLSFEGKARPFTFFVDFSGTPTSPQYFLCDNMRDWEILAVYAEVITTFDATGSIIKIGAVSDDDRFATLTLGTSAAGTEFTRGPEGTEFSAGRNLQKSDPGMITITKGGSTTAGKVVVTIWMAPQDTKPDGSLGVSGRSGKYDADTLGTVGGGQV